MSNDLHERATRAVAIALVPAFLAIAGAVAWQWQPLPDVRPEVRQVHRAEAFDIELAPAQQAGVIVQPTAVATTPKPRTIVPKRPAVTAPAAKTRHCEEYALYASGTEKVVLCEWQ